MNILVLDAYFFPEQIAFTHLEHDLLEGFVQAGHKVDVICPIPTRGIDKETIKKYKHIKSEKLYDGNVRVHRFWSPQEGRNPIIRAIRYVWCNLRTYQIGKKYKKTDVIFCNSTPPTQGWLAGKLKKKLKCRFIYSLQDIFPDSLLTTGLGKKGTFIYQIGSKIANSGYEAADTIVVISRSFKDNIVNKGVSESKIKLIYNWVDTVDVKPIEKANNHLFEELNITQDVPTVVYAGNFGASQNGGIILDVAKTMRNDNVQFIIFGGGSEFQSIRKKAESLSNVYCFDLMPLSRVSEVYSLGDIALITNAPGVGDCGMPSKLWSIMATNTPIVASIDPKSELAEIIINHANGKVATAGNVDEFVFAIREILNERSKIESNTAREYTKKWADRESAVARYLECL